MSKDDELRKIWQRAAPLSAKIIAFIVLAAGVWILDFRQANFGKAFQKEIERTHPELHFGSMVFESKSSVSYMTFDVALSDMPESEIAKYRDSLETDIKKTFCLELKKSQQDLKFQLFNVNVRNSSTEHRGFILASSISPGTCS